MSKQVLPYNCLESDKKEQVETMFDKIAWRYDFLNHFLSLGTDKRWRRKALYMLNGHKPRKILDVATGTADFAIEAAKYYPEKIVGIDISEEMLNIGRKKVNANNMDEVIQLQKGEAEDLHFEDNTFDAVIVAFGMRNFANLEKGLSEMKRVLKKGKQLLILEFSKPKAIFIKQLFGFYFHKVLPLIGRLVSKESKAYEYLPRSVAAFPEGRDMVGKLEDAGYKITNCVALTAGICTIYLCEKL